MKNFAVNAIALGIISIISVSQLAYGSEMNTGKELKAVVNGEAVENEIYKNENDTVMYPVREISEALGYKVIWNAENNSCTVSDEEKNITFVIGTDAYTVGSDISALGAAPELKDGVSYVPSAFLRGLLDLNVSENDDMITLTSQPEVMLEENNTATVRKGQLFGVRLEENASTGYTWSVEKNDEVELLGTNSVQAMNDEVPDGIKAVGAPSMKTWVYKCDVPGEYTLKYTYSRSTGETAEEKTAEFKVTVVDENNGTDEKNEITANVGENFSISLEESVSTGYAWTVEKDDKIQLIETIEAQEENVKGMLGVPITKTWTFRCDEAGEYNIKFTYARVFESDDTAQTVEYKVVIK